MFQPILIWTRGINSRGIAPLAAIVGIVGLLAAALYSVAREAGELLRLSG